MAKKKASKAAEKPEEKAAPKDKGPANYNVLINDGNLGAHGVHELDEIGAIAKSYLVDGKQPELRIKVEPVYGPGKVAGTGKFRLDGVRA